MNELQIAQFFLELALLLGLTYLAAILFAKLRLPNLLAALFVAIIIRYTPLGHRLLSGTFYPTLTIFADLGALFLLFFIGLQIDFKEMHKAGKHIAWLTFLSTFCPFLLTGIAMLFYGYGWAIAAIIGITQMPTAEAIVVPILDEFHMIKTRVGQFIIGASILDDLVEVFLITLVSIWIGEKSGMIVTSIESSVAKIIFSIIILAALAMIARQWFVPTLNKFLPPQARNLLLLSMMVLLGFGGFSTYANLGLILGAIIAGIVMQPTILKMDKIGEHASQVVQQISYGFLGLLFFFWVGLNVDLNSLISAPMLAILIYLAGTLGKFAGTFILVPFGSFKLKEAAIIGTGINGRFTTEIIVAKLLFDAHLINTHLFTALVAASAFSTLTVPIVLTMLINE
ncbi:MAG: cation:proton antiporter [Gammaproteobacteria bacterium]|nr:cation:proton antiporter [Gammaproteobacteria bacterium]